MGEKLMSLKVDFAFNELMSNKEICKGFISTVLGISVDSILEIEIQSIYLQSETEAYKYNVLDVKLLLKHKIQIDVEIRVLPFEVCKERILFYNNKIYEDVLKARQEYEKDLTLRKIVNINILGFYLYLFPESYFHNSFSIRNNKEEKKVLINTIEWHIIDISSLKELDLTLEADSLDNLSLWTAFIKESGENDDLLKILSTKNEYLKIAYEELKRISLDEQKKLKYAERQKELYIYKEFLNETRKIDRRKLASKLLDDGVPTKEVMEKTNLTFDELATLTNEMLLEICTVEQISELRNKGIIYGNLNRYQS